MRFLNTEERRLQRIGRTAEDSVKPRRAIVVLMSARDKAPRTWTGYLTDAARRGTVSWALLAALGLMPAS